MVPSLFLKLVVAIAACVAPASGQLFSQLRGGFPHVIRLPQGGQRLRLPQSQVLRLPEGIREAMMCCKAMTAECLACAAGQDLPDFCESAGGRVPGCREVMKKAREAKRDRAIDGVLTRVIEKAARATGGGQAEALADKYLADHPGVARHNLANLTGEAFAEFEQLKQHATAPTKQEIERPHHRPTAAPPAHGTHHRPPLSSSLDEDDDDEDDEEEPAFRSKGHGPWAQSFANPWFIAGGALLVTAISSGIAMGALCHARLNRSSREPLLSTLLHEMEPRGGAAPVAD